ncbi:MAG: DNA repair protein RecN, partial [Casimicrobiaceae bacterium]
LASTEAELAALADAGDAAVLAARAEAAEREFLAAAKQLAQKRQYAGNELSHRVTEAMQQLAMEGGHFEIGQDALDTPAGYGLHDLTFRVASHPKQPLASLARVASGGELSRIALAVQVAASEAGQIPTLVFDEVDSGVGGAVATTVGRLLQALGSRRQVLCVTHLPQVAACADVHLRVRKCDDDDGVRSELDRLDAAQRVEETARMLGGAQVTAKTRANARELLDASRRQAATRR